MPLVSQTYVNNLLKEMQDRNRTYHQKIDEIEQIRHLENPLALPAEERPSGLTVRIGAASQLIEDVKTAMTTSVPSVHIKALRSGDPAKENSSKREVFWSDYLASLLRIIRELADSQVGLGIGILKNVYYPWPKKARKRLPKESDTDFRARTKGLKRLWGPPFRLTTVHPLSFYPRFGAGEEIVESVEHSWMPRRDIYAAYGIEKLVDLDGAPQMNYDELPNTHAGSFSGQPGEEIRSLPASTDTTTMCLVTQYWQRPTEYANGVYVVYVDGRQVYEEADPGVNYEVCLGRTSVSKDPDKLGTSVAEMMRHNEPTLDRMLTRIAEATELLVRKRLTLEVPEGTIIPETIPEGENPDNRPQPKTFTFKPDVTEALPAGSKVVDPFAGVENVFQALPMIELMFRIIGNHGVSPIFRGIPPGAAGSGYRDNSLYQMAKSQFQAIQDSFHLCLGNQVRWMEEQLPRRVKQEAWMNDHPLQPSDVRGFPAEVKVEIKPMLPQNLIPEGQFYDRMWSQGHVTRRTVLEDGLHKDQPEQEMWDRDMEDLKAMAKPMVLQDALKIAGLLPKAPGLVGPNGQPLRGNGGSAAQSSAGYTRAGQPRQPPEMAGEFPPDLREPE